MKQFSKTCLLALPCLYRSIRSGLENQIDVTDCDQKRFRELIRMGSRYPYALMLSRFQIIRLLCIRKMVRQ
ncbi:hypothetical protein [Aquiflexum sp.]|uniref:hypothetical protein n=1 Tax=Aquiflexum sp. TaxID=1872584 RepID=UPI003594149E